jgi:hypothetical protein
MQQLAQIRSGLRVCGIRPKNRGEMLARLKHAGVQGKVRKQGLLPVRIDSRYDPPFISEPQTAEHLNTPDRQK